MTQNDYISEVIKLKNQLDELRLRNTLHIAALGSFGTVVEDAKVWSNEGFWLEIDHEEFTFHGDGSYDGSFRYRIFAPGKERYRDEPIIRLQTDDRNGLPINAHFEPNFGTRHFTIDRWPDWLVPPNLLKAYKLFTSIVRDNGQLPEIFRFAV